MSLENPEKVISQNLPELAGIVAKTYTRGQLCGFVMGLTFTLVASIFFYRYFTMTTTLHLVEQTMSDPALPFLQSLSYSTTGVQCGGKWVRIYDMLSAAAAGNSKTVVACGEPLNLEEKVGLQLKNLAQISNLCFDYGVAGADGKDMTAIKKLTTGGDSYADCKAALESRGKSVKSTTRASYLFPLPPDKGLIAKQLLTKVEPAETGPTATTATPSPTST